MSMSLYFLDGDAKMMPRRGERLNWGNRNAEILMSCLGFTVTNGGTDDLAIEDLIAACERFQSSDMASLVDQGREGKDIPNDPATQSVIDALGLASQGGDLREGYISDNVELILREAKMAKQNGGWKFYLG